MTGGTAAKKVYTFKGSYASANLFASADVLYLSGSGSGTVTSMTLYEPLIASDPSPVPITISTSCLSNAQIIAISPSSSSNISITTAVGIQLLNGASTIGNQHAFSVGPLSAGSLSNVAFYCSGSANWGNGASCLFFNGNNVSMPIVTAGTSSDAQILYGGTNTWKLGTNNNLMIPHWACVGCTTTPTQTTAGDLTAVRLWQGANQAFSAVSCTGATCSASGGTLSITVSAGAGGVSSITGTSGQIIASASTGSVTLSLPSTLVGIDSIQPDSSTTNFYIANFASYQNTAAPSAPTSYPNFVAGSLGYVIYGISGTATASNWYGQCLSSTSACLSSLGASTGVNFLTCGTSGCTMTPSLTSTTDNFQIKGTSGEVLMDLAGTSGDTVFPYASSGTTIVTFGTVGASASNIQLACNGASCGAFLTANAVQAFYCTTGACSTNAAVPLLDNGNRVLAGTPTCTGGISCSVSGTTLSVSGPTAGSPTNVVLSSPTVVSSGLLCAATGPTVSQYGTSTNGRQAWTFTTGSAACTSSTGAAIVDLTVTSTCPGSVVPICRFGLTPIISGTWSATAINLLLPFQYQPGTPNKFVPANTQVFSPSTQYILSSDCYCS